MIRHKILLIRLPLPTNPGIPPLRARLVLARLPVHFHLQPWEQVSLAPQVFLVSTAFDRRKRVYIFIRGFSLCAFDNTKAE